MDKKTFQKICLTMSDVCWLIAEDDKTTDKLRKKIVKKAEIFYRLYLQSKNSVKKLEAIK